MKTEDGFEYKQGKKYWHVRIKGCDSELLIITPHLFKPKVAFAFVNPYFLTEVENKFKVFVNKDFAMKWIQENKPLFDTEGKDIRQKLHSIIDTLSEDSCEDIIMVLNELEKAQKKHPVFPIDIFERLSVVTEEAGELAQAINNSKEGKGTFKEVEREVLQLCAVALRFKNNLIEMKTVD